MWCGLIKNSNISSITNKTINRCSTKATATRIRSYGRRRGMGRVARNDYMAGKHYGSAYGEPIATAKPDGGKHSA